MTNSEIILQEATAVYPPEQIECFLNEGEGIIPLHTYKHWRKLGFQVKRGEKAVVKTKLWTFKPAKQHPDDAATSDEEEKISESSFLLTPAYLFSFEQVERIEK